MLFQCGGVLPVQGDTPEEPAAWRLFFSRVLPVEPKRDFSLLLTAVRETGSSSASRLWISSISITSLLGLFPVPARASELRACTAFRRAATRGTPRGTLMRGSRPVPAPRSPRDAGLPGCLTGIRRPGREPRVPPRLKRLPHRSGEGLIRYSVVAIKLLFPFERRAAVHAHAPDSSLVVVGLVVLGQHPLDAAHFPVGAVLDLARSSFPVGLRTQAGLCGSVRESFVLADRHCWLLAIRCLWACAGRGAT